MKDQNILFNPDKLEEFRSLYNKAKQEHSRVFFFEDELFLVGYAKYAIEYLDGQFKTPDNEETNN